MFNFNSKKSNYEDRINGVSPNILLLHYTGMEGMEAARDRLSDPESKVSAHYLVDEDGSVFDLVPEDKRAWHAGLSYWAGESDINSFSIGIEMVNLGHEFGYHSFPDVQMASVKKLCREIMTRHDIEHVLGHSDVAPERKLDPGELFDWKGLSEYGVGLWAKPSHADYTKAELIASNDFEVAKLFTVFGYNPMAAFIDTVSAFHRHYYPEIFESGDEGIVCVETVARILSLIHQKS